MTRIYRIFAISYRITQNFLGTQLTQFRKTCQMRRWCHGGAGKSKNNSSSISENIHTERTLEMKSKRVPMASYIFREM